MSDLMETEMEPELGDLVEAAVEDPWHGTVAIRAEIATVFKNGKFRVRDIHDGTLFTVPRHHVMVLGKSA